jgi:hypothetical protein
MIVSPCVRKDANTDMREAKNLPSVIETAQERDAIKI